MIEQTEAAKDTVGIGLDESERQRCEVWTRVMGYHRPVSEFNPGKKSEHYERMHFVEPAAVGCGC
jgi:anaerobic ribonucleoside-triphosphate reductase